MNRDSDYFLDMNRLSMTDPTGTHNYAYDAIYRLIQAAHPTPPTEQFSYDPVGNRLSDGSGNAYFYNTANQMLNYNGVISEYDANGNTTSVTNNCGMTRYTWDGENRLIGINGFGPQCSPLSANFKYDPFGRRIEKDVNGAVTKYLYDEEDIIIEYDNNNQIISRYTHGHGIDEPLGMEKSGQSYFYHFDGLGSVSEITDSAGNIVQRYEYDSFGNIVSVLNLNFKQPYTYTGREYDPETGLYYYRARYYDARVGRFISEDPIGLDGEDVNFYTYVGNNPLRYLDPYGTQNEPPKPPPPSQPGQPVPGRPPFKPPPPPGMGCGAMFRVCMAYCTGPCPPGPFGIVKGVCIASCVLLWIACVAGGS